MPLVASITVIVDAFFLSTDLVLLSFQLDMILVAILFFKSTIISSPSYIARYKGPAKRLPRSASVSEPFRSHDDHSVDVTVSDWCNLCVFPNSQSVHAVSFLLELLKAHLFVHDLLQVLP